jgi:N-hydroxyarylamine O-acetyltransferase
VPDTLDLPAYLARIGVQDAGSPNLPTLVRLHRAHIAAIPFENLDIQMGRPIELDAESLQAALIRRRRGGYCFQQNGLFAAVLTQLGYVVSQREARVRLDATNGVASPRTHLISVVQIDGREWLADVGFGGSGIVEPLDLETHSSVQDGWIYRVIREGRLRVLQRARGNGWDDLYAFAEDEVAPIDCIVGNWYTSTHRDSRFVRTLTVQRMIGDTRHVLRNLTYSVARAGGDWQTRELTRAELVPLLRDVFGLDVPADARFRAIDDRPAS